MTHTPGLNALLQWAWLRRWLIERGVPIASFEVTEYGDDWMAQRGAVYPKSESWHLLAFGNTISRSFVMDREIAEPHFGVKVVVYWGAQRNSVYDRTEYARATLAAGDVVRLDFTLRLLVLRS